MASVGGLAAAENVKVDKRLWHDAKYVPIFAARLHRPADSVLLAT